MLSQQKNTYTIIGLMSGTSLDGLDICAVEFNTSDKHLNFNIVAAETIYYSEKWLENFCKAENLSAQDLIALDRAYGNYLGEAVNEFIKKHNVAVDLIASHGHTIFHQTERGFSFQIGSGANIAAKTNSIVINDFRSLDVALGGQGAPLVPASEQFLFPDYTAFLNLGGIANFSVHKNKTTVAYDICPANMLLNYISLQKLKMPYDPDGILAKNGNLIKPLYHLLNQIPYYKINGPKSLGKEYIFKYFIPLLDFSRSAEDLLHTCTIHIVNQLKADLPKEPILVSGGGTYNQFLIEQLKLNDIEVVIPSKELIEFKEALIFAHLGLRRFLGQKNTLHSVTGANRDNIGGAIYDGRSL